MRSIDNRRPLLVGPKRVEYHAHYYWSKSCMVSCSLLVRLNSFVYHAKGCANDLVPDFHIVAETAVRPRFQCGLCSRQCESPICGTRRHRAPSSLIDSMLTVGEIGSSGHWDGPLGGGNDLLRRNTVNGWFFNHKALFLFYESYLDPQNCKRVSLML